MQERRHQRIRALRPQGLDPQVTVRRLLAPVVPILGAVAHQQQDARAWKDLHETVEPRLRLDVDRVQVLDDDDDGLDVTLAQEELLDRLQHARAALRSLHLFPLQTLHRGVEQE